MSDAAAARARELDIKQNCNEYSTFLCRVINQVNLNTAAWYVFFELLKSYAREVGNQFDVDRSIFRKAWDVLKRRATSVELADQPLLMRVEVNLFLWLFDDDQGAGEASRDLLSSAQTERMLRLDADTLDLYRRAFGKRLAAKESKSSAC